MSRPAAALRRLAVTLALAVLAAAALAFGVFPLLHPAAPSPVAYFCPSGQIVTGVKAGWPQCAPGIFAAAPVRHSGGTPLAVIVVVVLAAAGVLLAWWRPVMKRDDRKAWRSARTLEDLGELTARWLEGTIGEQPGYCGPSDLDDPELLVPVCAALCRSGYMTTQSQHASDGPGYDGMHWQERAAVEGFATETTARRLIDAARDAGLAVIAHDPAALPRRRFDDQLTVIVTRRDGVDRTGFGAHLPRRFIRGTYDGICHRDAVDALCNAWQVTVIDPEWGRPELLWNTLAALCTEEVSS